MDAPRSRSVRFSEGRDSSLGAGAAGGVERHSQERIGEASARLSVGKNDHWSTVAGRVTGAEVSQQQTAQTRLTQQESKPLFETVFGVDAEALLTINASPKNATQATHEFRW